MNRFVVPKLTGLALLTMITLILISVLEVSVYSYLINPGHDQTFYEAHANQSAPYISGIFGFLIFFLVARYWTKKNHSNVLKLVLLYPAIYVTIDIIILVLAGVDWSEFFLIFLLANAAKFLGSLLGYKLYAFRTGGPGKETPVQHP